MPQRVHYNVNGLPIRLKTFLPKNVTVLVVEEETTGGWGTYEDPTVRRRKAIAMEIQRDDEEVFLLVAKAFTFIMGKR